MAKNKESGRRAQNSVKNQARWTLKLQESGIMQHIPPKTLCFIFCTIWLASVYKNWLVAIFYNIYLQDKVLIQYFSTNVYVAFSERKDSIIVHISIVYTLGKHCISAPISNYITWVFTLFSTFMNYTIYNGL